MTRRQELLKAVSYVRGLVVAFTRRRPTGFPPYAADGALEALRIARIQLEKVEMLYETHQGLMPLEKDSGSRRAAV
jgi:hypothetical protein